MMSNMATYARNQLYFVYLRSSYILNFLLILIHFNYYVQLFKTLTYSTSLLHMLLIEIMFHAP